jgi:hypothetical protein
LQHPEYLGAYVNSISNNVVLEYLRGKSRPEQWDEPIEETARSGRQRRTVQVSEEQSR